MPTATPIPIDAITTKPVRTITLLATSPSDDMLNFKEIYAVDPQYLMQAIQMSQVFQDAINPDSLQFDFQKAIEIVKQHPTMAVVQEITQTIHQSNGEVSAMVDKVTALLQNVVGISLSPAQSTQLTSIIAAAFTNLSIQESNAWIFWSKEEAHKTTYQYNIMFAVQNETTGSIMLAIPISLTITVNIEKESVLFITISDNHEYNVLVQAIKVAEALLT